MGLPSVAQMKNRSTGHIGALRKIADGERPLRANAAPSEMRGMQTLLQTLLRWKCIQNVKTDDSGWRYVITDRGRQLLDS